MTAIYDELNQIRELSSTQVEEWLGRRHGWARRHIVELGGYRDGVTYRFPIHGVKAYQEARATAFAEERRAS